MPDIPIIKAKDFFKYLTRFDCSLISIRGSHHKIINKSNGKISVLAIHTNSDLSKGAFSGTLKQLGIDINEFINFTKNN